MVFVAIQPKGTTQSCTSIQAKYKFRMAFQMASILQPLGKKLPVSSCIISPQGSRYVYTHKCSAFFLMQERNSKEHKAKGIHWKELSMLWQHTYLWGVWNYFNKNKLDAKIKDGDKNTFLATIRPNFCLTFSHIWSLHHLYDALAHVVQQAASPYLTQLWLSYFWAPFANMF